MNGHKQVEIAVGIVRAADCRIFITQRGENSYLAGYWEFPGGKIEAGETAYQALCRELAEEIDIHVLEAQFLKTVTHEYGDRTITLHAYLVEHWDGEPFAKEGQPSRWVTLDELNADEFPEANRSLIEMLKNLEKVV